MFYAVLKSIHLLASIAWIGGMFFTLACLRPALGVLDGPLRQRLMSEVLRRFLAVVGIAIVLMLVSGGWMLANTARVSSNAGLAFNLPLDWLAMIALGLVMIAIFGHIRYALFKRLQRAQQAQDAPAGAAALAGIRRWVGVNLALGVLIVIVMGLGAAP
jgi:uncharacterized membrane protein